MGLEAAGNSSAAAAAVAAAAVAQPGMGVRLGIRIDLGDGF